MDLKPIALVLGALLVGGLLVWGAIAYHVVAPAAAVGGNVTLPVIGATAVPTLPGGIVISSLEKYTINSRVSNALTNEAANVTTYLLRKLPGQATWTATASGTYTAGPTSVATDAVTGETAKVVSLGNSYYPVEASGTVGNSMLALSANAYQAATASLRAYTKTGAQTNASNSSFIVIPAGSSKTYVEAVIDTTGTAQKYVAPAFVVYFDSNQIKSVNLVPITGGTLSPLSLAVQRFSSQAATFSSTYQYQVNPASEAELATPASSGAYSMQIETQPAFTGSTTIYVGVVSKQPYVCTATTGAVQVSGVGLVCQVAGANYQVGEIVPAQYETTNSAARTITGQAADSALVPVYVSVN